MGYVSLRLEIASFTRLKEDLVYKEKVPFVNDAQGAEKSHIAIIYELGMDPIGSKHD